LGFDKQESACLSIIFGGGRWEKFSHLHVTSVPARFVSPLHPLAISMVESL